MSKVIYIIPVLLLMFLLTVNCSRSQHNYSDQNEKSMEISDSDSNQQNKVFKLYQNELSESKNVEAIKFDLKIEAFVILNVIDNNGMIIQNLVDGEMMPGTYCMHFKPADMEVVKDLSYKIEVNGETETRKMLMH